MKRVDGIIIEGENLGIEKKAARDNKVTFNLGILRGIDSIKIGVKDIELVTKLEAIPKRKPMKILVDIGTFKDELYLQAKELLA